MVLFWERINFLSTNSAFFRKWNHYSKCRELRKNSPRFKAHVGKYFLIISLVVSFHAYQNPVYRAGISNFLKEIAG